MARPKNIIRNFRTEVISAPEAALLLNLPERTLRHMAENGVLPKAAKGEYILGDVTEAYWKHVLGSEGLEAEQTRLTKAKADKAEIELAELKGEMHSYTDVESAWTEDVMNAKTRLLAIPTKLAPELVGKSVQEIQAALKKEIYEALYELAGYDGQRIARAAASRK